MTSITFWGLTASPYQLKMQSIADFAEQSWRRLPEQGRALENLRFLHRLRKARAARGQRCFNETAFEKGEALYDGELMGRPFRAVVKTFQVEVWRELLHDWNTLAPNARTALLSQYPTLKGIAGAPAPA